MAEGTFVHRHAVNVPAAGAAVTQNTIVDEMEVAGVLTEAAIIPAAGVTFNATNYRTFQLINRGATGAGTTVMATLDTASVSLVTRDKALMTLSAVAGATTFAAGDVLDFVETVAASGVAHTGMRVQIKHTRTVS